MIMQETVLCFIKNQVLKVQTCRKVSKKLHYVGERKNGKIILWQLYTYKSKTEEQKHNILHIPLWIEA